MLPIAVGVSGLAFQRDTTTTRMSFTAAGVLGEAWRLYTRLWTRSLLIGGLIFGVLHLIQIVVRSRGGLLVGLLTVVLTLMGTSLLQGALVEVVRGLHEDGDDDPSALEALGRAGAKLGRLVGVALIQSIGIGLGMLLFVVPGLLALTRWAVAVPVAMLEDRKTDDAIRRSKEILTGNGWNVFKVIFASGLLTVVVTIPFSLVGARAGLVGWWVASTLASMIAAPYAAHALTVVYFALVQPERPVVLDPGQSFTSVWAEQAATTTSAADSVWAEYEKKFDERAARWGA
jgi:hypothetical protein